MGTWTSWWQRTLRHVVWIFQVWLMSTTTIFHKIQKSYVHRIGRTGSSWENRAIHFFVSNEMGYRKSLRTWLKSGWRGMKPASSRSLQAKKTSSAEENWSETLRMKKIRTNFEKFGKDARKIIANSLLKNWLYLELDRSRSRPIQKLKLRVKTIAI